MTRSNVAKLRPDKAELSLADRCALAYAARVLYFIPYEQPSNALDMVDMIEGEDVGRGGYLLGQARAIWNASTYPAPNYFASDWQRNALCHTPEAPPQMKLTEAEFSERWEKYIAEQVAAIKAEENSAEHEAELERLAKSDAAAA